MMGLWKPRGGPPNPAGVRTCTDLSGEDDAGVKTNKLKAKIRFLNRVYKGLELNAGGA